MYNRTGEHKNTQKTVAAGEFKQDDVLVLRRGNRQKFPSITAEAQKCKLFLPCLSESLEVVQNG